MAYSAVGKPVFYIDNYLYHKTIGTNITTNIPGDAFTLSPATSSSYTSDNDINLPVSTDYYDFNGNMKYYFAFLNHRTTYSLVITPSTNSPMTITEVLNVNAEDSDGGDSNTISPLKGSTIFTTTTTGISSFTITNFAVGAISTGIQYTMPHSPDLKLSMEVEMDGVDTITTSGGGSISNIKYTGNPLWVSGSYRTNPFDIYSDQLQVNEVDAYSIGARRHGRKSWNLKFSYVSDTDLFSSNPRASSYTEHPDDSTYEASDLDGTGGESYLAYNIETDHYFYAQVWNKTLGGALNFIFQPDSNHNDDFYICKFDQDSLRVSQDAFKTYSISLKIVEVW